MIRCLLVITLLMSKIIRISFLLIIIIEKIIILDIDILIIFQIIGNRVIGLTIILLMIILCIVCTLILKIIILNKIIGLILYIIGLGTDLIYISENFKFLVLYMLIYGKFVGLNFRIKLLLFDFSWYLKLLFLISHLTLFLLYLQR